MTAPADMAGTELAAFLSALPGWPWLGPLADVAAMAGGLTNRTFRASTVDGTALFIKVPGTGTEAFIDRRVAHAALSSAAIVGVAPRPLYFDQETGIEVTEFLDGYSSATEGLLSNPGAAVEIARIYRRLHSTALLPQTKTIFDMFDEHLDQLRALNYPLGPWAEGLIETWLPAQQAFVAAGIDIVPCHNDMNATNYMIKKNSPIRLVDFDYASNNERAYEVGGFAQVYMLEEQTRRDMVEEYFGTVTEELEARIRIAGLACDMKWGLWGLLSATLADTDMDYVKFGKAKLINAENVMRTPQFAKWIRAL